MTSIKTNQDFELEFTDEGICKLVEGIDDVVQAIRTELEQNRGQFALNTSWGMPYLNKNNTGMLQIKGSKERLLAEVSRVIRKYKEVESILELDYIDGNITGLIVINGKEVQLG